MDRAQIQKVFNHTIKAGKLHKAVLLVENGDVSFQEKFSYGGCEVDTTIVAASITKMFTTACILKCMEKGLLSLDDKLSHYFDEDILRGLHVYKNTDYTQEITIRNLLFQNSGFPDSFEAGDISEVLREDKYTSFDDFLEITKQQKAHFVPGQGNKAYYANINFDLLGEILCKILQMPINEVYQQLILEPLEMKHSYVASEDAYVPPIYYGELELNRPKTIRSGIPSGGIISTASDLMIFNKAFWGGRLFNLEILPELTVYRRLQANKGPVKYGGGYMQMKLGTITTSFMGKGELLGHFGTTGSFMFYYPEKDLYFVGDLNQFKNPALPFRLLLRLAMLR